MEGCRHCSFLHSDWGVRTTVGTRTIVGILVCCCDHECGRECALAGRNACSITPVQNALEAKESEIIVDREGNRAEQGFVDFVDHCG